MRVYHASPFIVDKPDVVHSRNNLDFGKGFYVTTLREQAISYARRFTLRGKRVYLNTYLFDQSVVGRVRTAAFDFYSEEWLDFVMSCRRGMDQTNWDMVFGGVANDRIFATVDLYSNGQIAKSEALGRLAFEEPNNQLCIRTQSALDASLSFLGSEEL